MILLINFGWHIFLLLIWLGSLHFWLSRVIFLYLIILRYVLVTSEAAKQWAHPVVRDIFQAVSLLFARFWTIVLKSILFVEIVFFKSVDFGSKLTRRARFQTTFVHQIVELKLEIILFGYRSHWWALFFPSSIGHIASFLDAAWPKCFIISLHTISLGSNMLIPRRRTNAVAQLTNFTRIRKVFLSDCFSLANVVEWVLVCTLSLQLL